MTNKNINCIIILCIIIMLICLIYEQGVISEYACITEDDFVTEEKQRITTDEFIKLIKTRVNNKYTFTYTKILECLVTTEGKNISTNKEYNKILVDIWKTMSVQQIQYKIIHSTTPIKEKGYIWHPELQFAFRNKDAANTMLHILRMIELNRYTIKISIRLNTGKIIYYEA